MKKHTSYSLAIAGCLLLLIFVQSCVILRPGEAAVITKYGKLKSGVLTQGFHGVSPFSNRVVRFSTRVTEYSSNSLHLPTKEGLEITAEMTFLHHLNPDSIPSIYRMFGMNYNQSLIINTYIATSREITAHYYAKDLITQREELEKAIHDKLVTSLSRYGIVMDVVLVRDIELPAEILQAIQNKVRSEQASLQAQFDIEKQRKELEFNIETQRKQADFAIEKQKKDAERMVIEAEAIKKSQEIINSSITENLLRFKSLDIAKGLVTSANAKIIITDGKSPLLLNDATK